MRYLCQHNSEFMKKISTLIAAFAAGTVSLFAQSQVEFVDALSDGNVIADGTVLTVCTVEEDEFSGDAMMSSGLFVRNMASEDVLLAVECTIDMPNGSHQICFPAACTFQYNSQVFVTPVGSVLAGMTLPLLAEWMPKDYGKCVVTYGIKYYEMQGKYPNIEYVFTSNGPSVTVNYANNDPASVGALEGEASVRAVEYYNMNGSHAGGNEHGVLIKKVMLSNGMTCVGKVVK